MSERRGITVLKKAKDYEDAEGIENVDGMRLKEGKGGLYARPGSSFEVNLHGSSRFEVLVKLSSVASLSRRC